MKKKLSYLCIITSLILLSCSSNNQTPTPPDDSFEDVEEFILCSEITFLENLDACFTVNITSSLGSESFEDCYGNSSNICLTVPAQELITFDIEYIDSCGISRVYTEVHGPFTFDPSLDDVEITIDNSYANSTYDITGVLQDCNNNLIYNGVAILNIAGKQIIDFVNNGEFAFYNLECLEEGTSFTIQAIDFETKQSSGVLTFSLTDTTLELNPISTCNPLHEFITYQVSNHPVITYENTEFVGQIDEYINHVGCAYNGNSFSLHWNQLFSIYLTDSNGDLSDPSIDPGINLTEHSIGAVNEFIILSFRGYIYHFDEDGFVKARYIKGLICVLRDS